MVMDAVLGVAEALLTVSYALPSCTRLLDFSATILKGSETWLSSGCHTKLGLDTTTRNLVGFGCLRRQIQEAGPSIPR